MTRNEKIRISLNPSTPPEVLTQLARDEDYDVRWRVARNPSTSPEVLLILVVDNDEYVREEAESNLRRRILGP